MNFSLVFCIVHLKRQEFSRRKDRLSRGIHNVAFQSANHNLLKLLFVRFNSFCKTLIIQKFQKRGKRLLIAIVRRGREKQVMREMGREPLNYLSALAGDRICRGSRRSDIVGFINYQDIKHPWITDLRRKNIFQKTQSFSSLDPIHGSDEPRV